MKFTTEQLKLIESYRPGPNGVLLFGNLLAPNIALAHGEVVSFTSSEMEILTGVFKIEEVFGETEIDLSNPEELALIDAEEIVVSVTCPGETEPEVSRFTLDKVQSIKIADDSISEKFPPSTRG
ncbi:MAG: hypothetical protein JRF33_26655 [Deltaproteobacteria bacterium]|nr:hypothetical protein [Deltaproteobacteria bacterium]